MINEVGIRTNKRDEVLLFWTETIGLPYEELLKVGGGVHQHRLHLNGSIFKLNHTRDPIADTAPSGYHRLYIASNVDKEKNLKDPGGSLVTLVPKGSRGITHIGIGMKVRSLPSARAFFQNTLEAESIGDDQFRLGTTVFLLQQADRKSPKPDAPAGKGYRYITIQVCNIDDEHQGVLARGAQEASPPQTHGSTARISFILDPDGNVIELSQRASLTAILDAG